MKHTRYKTLDEAFEDWQHVKFHFSFGQFVDYLKQDGWGIA